MKKEVFLAVLVGFILGLIITFGIWTANKSFRSQGNAPSPTPLAAVTPSPTPAASQLVLTVSEPADEALVNSDSVTVSGKTSAQTPVVINSEKGQTVVVSDSSGNFSADIDLEAGYNRLHLEAVDASGFSTAKDLLVTYTTSKI